MNDRSTDTERNCPETPPCNYEDYKIIQVGYVSNLDGYNTLQLTFASNFIEVVQSELNFDKQGLVGDVGGSLGLFMGLCGLGLLEIATSLFDKYLSGRAKNAIVVFPMCLLFVFWATPAIYKYLDEPLSTESVNLEGNDMKSEFPMVTFCSLGYEPYNIGYGK